MRHAKYSLVLVGMLVAVMVLAGCGASSASTGTT